GVLHVAWVEGTGQWQGPIPVHSASRRICQLTGDTDPDFLPHINRSSKFGVGGTDLGFPVEYNYRNKEVVVFLFGDQVGSAEQRDLDPIGFTEDGEVAAHGVSLGYVTPHGVDNRFLPFSVTGFPPLLALETPTGGFGDNGRLWAFLNKQVEETANSQT